MWPMHAVKTSAKCATVDGFDKPNIRAFILACDLPSHNPIR